MDTRAVIALLQVIGMKIQIHDGRGETEEIVLNHTDMEDLLHHGRVEVKSFRSNRYAKISLIQPDRY